MPKFTDRLSENVPGKFYVDSQCTDCDLCRETAPEIFKRSDEGGCSYVYRQPVTDDEIEKTLEAVEGCCVSCIGTDGDKNDWSIPPEDYTEQAFAEKRTCGCKSGTCATDAGRLGEAPLPEKPTAPETNRPWWKFWA